MDKTGTLTSLQHEQDPPSLNFLRDTKSKKEKLQMGNYFCKASRLITISYKQDVREKLCSVCPENAT